MTEEEAKKVLEIMATTDGGNCSSCTHNLFNLFNKEFSGFEGISEEVGLNNFGVWWRRNCHDS
jgi:hypothetical protein